MQAPHVWQSLAALGALLLHFPKGRDAVVPAVMASPAVDIEQFLRGNAKDLRGLTDISELFFS
jgi:hypothetical protein